VYGYVAGEAKRPAEEGDPKEFHLAEHPQLKGEVPHNERDIEEALVIRNEYIGAVAVKAVEPFHLDPDSCYEEEKTCPPPGNNTCRVTCAVYSGNRKAEGGRHRSEECQRGEDEGESKHHNPYQRSTEAPTPS